MKGRPCICFDPHCPGLSETAVNVYAALFVLVAVGAGASFVYFYLTLARVWVVQ